MNYNFFIKDGVRGWFVTFAFTIYDADIKVEHLGHTKVIANLKN